MKIAVITDLHTISPHTKLIDVREHRIYFADAWPYFKKMNQRIHEEAPDLVICLGDMVDFYSDENRDFALSLLEELPCPWVSVPGNHDYESYAEVEAGLRPISAVEGKEAAVKGWKERGIELHHRYIDAGGDTGIILLDSAVSGVPEGTKEWLESIKTKHARQLLFTHVPLDIPEMRDYILSISPKRNLKKYTQSKSPWVYREGLDPNRISDVFTGHLHIPGGVTIGQTRMHMLGMSVKDLRFEEATASGFIVEVGDTVDVRPITFTSL